MKVTVIGSHLCPDTLYALCKLTEKQADIDFKNLSASLPDLKQYLEVGIPYFELEDGTGTLDLNEVMARI